MPNATTFTTNKMDLRVRRWLVGPGCMRLRPNDLVHPVYLLHYPGSPGALEWLVENSNQSVIRCISTDDLGQLPVQLPPMSTQVELAATFEAFDAQASAHRRLAEETEEARNLLLPVVLPKPPGS